MQLFDAHFHIIDPCFPLVSNQGYLPPAFGINDYRKQTQGLEIIGGSIVSGSFQAYDHQYLSAALRRLGNSHVGVANIPETITAEELKHLHQIGVRAVRFNLQRGGSQCPKQMGRLSQRLHEEYGWRTELYVDSADLALLSAALLQFPSFSIDHLGLSKAGLTSLYAWAEKGARIKATGFGRLDFDPIPVMRQLMDINPQALMFGTDLPSTRAKRPFALKDIYAIEENFSLDEQRLIFHANAIDWYGLPQKTGEKCNSKHPA